jgi:hypothetical protein
VNHEQTVMKHPMFAGSDDGTGRPTEQHEPLEYRGPGVWRDEWTYEIRCNCNIYSIGFFNHESVARAKKFVEQCISIRKRSFATLAHNPGCALFT